MTPSEKPHYPKGSMCVLCQHRGEDCSGLDFMAMPPIRVEPDRVVVKCVKFERVDRHDAG